MQSCIAGLVSAIQNAFKLAHQSVSDKNWDSKTKVFLNSSCVGAVLICPEAMILCFV